MLTIWTYDRMPGGENGPRGFVRDLRVRWACDEAALDYELKSTPLTIGVLNTLPVSRLVRFHSSKTTA